MAEILDGKLTAKNLRMEIKEEVKEWTASGGKKPHLAAILVGDDGS